MTMTRAHRFIQALRDAGFAVTTDGKLLWISPRARLTTCDQEFILANRPDIIAVLEAENAAAFVRQRLAEQRHQTAAQAA
jgi:hypothetical protein